METQRGETKTTGKEGIAGSTASPGETAEPTVSRTRRSEKREKSKLPPEVSAEDGVSWPLGAFDRIARTRVYRLLPAGERAELDAAILVSTADCSTVVTTAEKLGLAERFGVRMTDIRHYASLLESFARPIMAALAVSALIKALPRRLTTGLHRANKVLIWSRLVQRLSDPESERLTASEFARIAALLQSARDGRKPRGGTKGKAGGARDSKDTIDGASFVEVVRSAVGPLYGLQQTTGGVATERAPE